MITPPIIHKPSRNEFASADAACDYLFRLIGKSKSPGQPETEQMLLDNGFVWPYQAPTVQSWQQTGDPVLVAGVWTLAVSDKPLTDIKAEAKRGVKLRRDAILKQYSERLVIYQANYDAAKAVLAGTGDTTTMQNGATAAVFAANCAAAMGLASPEAWATYIVGEWTNLGALVDQMEREYLRLTYHPTNGIDSLATAQAVQQAADAFLAAY